MSDVSEKETKWLIEVGAFYTDWRDEGIQQTVAIPMMRCRQFSN